MKVREYEISYYQYNKLINIFSKSLVDEATIGTSNIGTILNPIFLTTKTKPISGCLHSNYNFENLKILNIH